MGTFSFSRIDREQEDLNATQGQESQKFQGSHSGCAQVLFAALCRLQPFLKTFYANTLTLYETSPRHK